MSSPNASPSGARSFLPSRCRLCPRRGPSGQFLRLVCLRFRYQPSVFKPEGMLRQQLKRLENCAQRDDSRLTMKSQLIAIVAAVLVVGCGESQQSAPAPEAKPVEPVAEAATPKPPTAKAPDISIHKAAANGNIEAVKQHIAAGTDVNARRAIGDTPLDGAIQRKRTETIDLLRKHGGKTGDELKVEGK